MMDPAIEAISSFNLVVSDLQNEETVEAMHSSWFRLDSQMNSDIWFASPTPTCTWENLLRGAGDAAAVLASLSLENLSAPTSFTSSPMPPSHGRLFRARAALDVANLLLALTLGGLQLGCRLEPRAVQRLVSCASVALGPAAQAAQLLYNEYAVADKPPDHHYIASEVADCFAKIFDVTAQAVAVVRRLKGQDPAGRLMATVCQPEKARALCHQAAPILLWCVEEQVAPTSALERLSYLLDQHGQLSNFRRLLRQGPSSPALASLAVHQYTALCRQLLDKQLACTETPAPSILAMGAAGTAAAPAAAKAAETSAAAAASDPPSWLAEWKQGFRGSACFLRNAAPWLHLAPRNASAACTLATATVLTLHRLARQDQVAHNVLELSIAALVDLAAGLLRLPSCCQHSEEHKTQQQQRQAQQRQHQGQGQERQAPLRISTEGLEAVAVCCSGLNALLELGSQEPTGSRWTVALNDAIRLQDTLVDRLDEGVLFPKQLPTAVAAAESALRLAAQLIKSWPALSALPGAQQEGLPTRVAEVYSCLRLGAVELVKSATSALSQLPEQSSHGSSGTAPDGSRENQAGRSSQQASTGMARDESSLSASDLAALGRSVAHLAASAAKLGELQADTAAQAVTCLAEDDVWLIPVAMLVCEVHSLQSSRSSAEAQGLLVRRFAGSMLPMVGTFSKLNASNPTLILLPDSSGQNLVQPTLDRMGALAELLARLDAMPAEAVAWLQETLLDALHRGWHAMLDLADEIPKWRAELSKGLGLAAGCIAVHAKEWQRSAYLAVQMGFVLDLAVWAGGVTSAEGCSAAYTKGLQGAWQMVEAVSHRVILQAGDDPATAVAGRVVREVLQRVEQLGPARQRKQQRSPRFWEQQVEQELLPALDTLASAAAAKGPPFDAQLRELLVLRAMATRVCTNPGCCNIRGCSESRVRSRRCSGCGVARYCCHACQLADFWAHRKVCLLLAAEASPESLV